MEGILTGGHPTKLDLTGQARQRLGLVHRLVEAAQLVDQAQRLGLFTGPDPALGDLAHPLGRQVAPHRDPRHEVIVDAVHPPREGGPLSCRERLADAERPGVLTADPGLANIDPEAGQGWAHRELAAEHPD